MKQPFTYLLALLFTLTFVQCSTSKMAEKKETADVITHDHSQHSHGTDSTSVPHEHLYMAKSTEADTMKSDGFKTILYTYFKMCEALSKEDKTVAADYAGSMFRAIERINTDSLAPASKLKWLSRKEFIKEGAMKISNAGNIIEEQRSYLSQLSLNIFDLVQLNSSYSSLYLFYCEYSNYGKGGNWIASKNDIITNPYQSFNREPCGSLIETSGLK